MKKKKPTHIQYTSQAKILAAIAESPTKSIEISMQNGVKALHSMYRLKEAEQIDYKSKTTGVIRGDINPTTGERHRINYIIYTVIISNKKIK